MLASGGIALQAQRRTRGVIRRQARHLSRLLDDLPDLPRTTRGKPELGREPAPAGSLVDTAFEAAVGPCPPGRREVAARALAVDLDAARIAQVLTNPLNEARKFTDPGGCVVLCRPSSRSRSSLRRRARPPGGQGAGPALARGVVDPRGDQAQARGEASGHGSVFAVRRRRCPDRSGRRRRGPAAV